MFECPGCGENHGLTVRTLESAHPSWEWNGDLDRPTLNPSILARGHKFVSKDESDDRTEPYVCHSFVREGRIQFLGDCTHALANQTVDLLEIEAHA